MYAVIFRALINKLDNDYIETADRMKNLALNKYGCIEFTSVTEENQEIAISYWETEDQIKLWKEDPEHRMAQALGNSRWYKSYHVQVVEIIREYRKNE